MSGKFRPPAQGPAIGTPLSGAPGRKKVDRPPRLRVAAVVVGGLVAAWAAQKMPGYVPTVIATSSILAAFIYWHHNDPRLAVTVATWPVVAIATFAAANTWKHPAKTIAKQSDVASVAFGGGIWDLLDSGKAFAVAWAQANPKFALIGAALVAVVVVGVRKARAA